MFWVSIVLSVKPGNEPGPSASASILLGDEDECKHGADDGKDATGDGDHGDGDVESPETPKALK